MSIPTNVLLAALLGFGIGVNTDKHCWRPWLAALQLGALMFVFWRSVAP